MSIGIRPVELARERLPADSRDKDNARSSCMRFNHRNSLSTHSYSHFGGSSAVSLLICFGLAGWTLMQGQKHGARAGMWIGWIVALILCPAWMIKWIGPASLDPRMCAAGAGLLLIFTSNQKPSIKITLMDICFLGFFFVNIVSQQVNNDLTAGTILAFVRRWVFPYLVGRFFISKHDDLEKLIPYFAKFLLICSILAIVEAVSQKNWVNFLLGKSFYILDNTSEGFRWGMKRAHGNTEHPIYFGLMMVMLLPWGIEAGRAAIQKRGPKWWKAVPVLMFIAIVVTVSRGAQIASVICFIVAFFFRKPKWRVIIIIGAIVMGLGKDAIKDTAMSILSKAAGEEQHEEKWVPINGEEYLYTGTKHRMLLFIAYERGIDNAGWFGYGAAMKKVPVYEDAAERFSSIDCHYLVLLLQHGWGGIYTFCGMLFLSIIYAALSAWRTDAWSAHITGAMCGSMIAVGILMLSAFFHPHYGGVFMFCCGFLACVRAMSNQTIAPDNDEEDTDNASEMVDSDGGNQRRVNRRRATPGHAPVRVWKLDDHS